MLQAKQEVIQKILNFYGIVNFQIDSPSSGYRNTSYPITTDDKKFNLIFYKTEPGILTKIKNSNKVSNYLFEKGFPTRKSVNKILRVKSGSRIYYVCLYNYLEGETIPWEAYTKEHLKLLGGMMSKMHSSLESLNSKIFPNAINELEILNSEMIKYFSEPNVKRALEQKLNLEINVKLHSFHKIFERLKLMQSQPLHLDFVRGNVLFKSTKSENTSELKSLNISGILDFEKTAFGPRIVDIARTLAFLTTDCKYKSESKIRKYFLISGYQKRGETKLPNLKYLDLLLRFYWFHDFYKFLKHNPYEYLYLNEHFIRTIEILKREKLLT